MREGSKEASSERKLKVRCRCIMSQSGGWLDPMIPQEGEVTTLRPCIYSFFPDPGFSATNKISPAHSHTPDSDK